MVGNEAHLRHPSMLVAARNGLIEVFLLFFFVCAVPQAHHQGQVAGRGGAGLPGRAEGEVPPAEEHQAPQPPGPQQEQEQPGLRQEVRS